MNTPTVLVTGAAGRLGRAVAELAHAEHIDVIATDRVTPDTTPYRFVGADLRDHVATSELLADVDVVFHIGNHPGIGGTPPQVVFNENVTINENVFQGAAERGVSAIVFASTIQLIGSHPDTRTVTTPARRPRYPLDETTPPDPSNVYALSKQVAETMLRYYAERCGIAATALRLPLLHHHEQRFIATSGSERPADVVEAFAGLSYGDAARLFLAAWRAPHTGYRAFVAGTSHRHGELSVAELIDRFYPEVAPGTSDLVDYSAATQATGWRPLDTYHPPVNSPSTTRQEHHR